MRRKVHLYTSSENNGATNKWIQLLIQRIIVEQLDVSYQLRARLLHQALTKARNEEDKSGK
ncbi:hypothetical protein IEO70_06735 [Bacillus sp. AGMB 02131]|uniref:Uncharacterized protein n=1 Tax=Peribacillus faecalis TaxID=2772559 RepID=A0A927CZ87_9BACI|nr:hypothetical protein [Peribacillus faecalis]MBD3108059.1 hypothetical protein [Peribacillus faecalis]